MANEDSTTLNNADIINAITNLNLPTNGNGQNTAVVPSPHNISKARTLESKALAIQNLQQAAALKQANEAFSKQVASTIPSIDIPTFVGEELPTVDLPSAPTEEDMTTPFTELDSQPTELSTEELPTEDVDKPIPEVELQPEPKQPEDFKPILSEEQVKFKAQFLPLAKQAAKNNNIPSAIFEQIIYLESKWDPKAQSDAGAMGLGQFMPDTATKDMGLTLDKKGGPGSVWHPESNLNAAAKYLRAGFDRYTKQGFSPAEAWKISAAAYNAGMGNIANAMKRVSGPVKSWKQIAAVLPQETGKKANETINYVNELTGAITSSTSTPKSWDTKLGESVINFSKELIDRTGIADLNVTEFAKSVIKKHGKKLGISWDPDNPDNSEGNKKAVELLIEQYGPELGISIESPDTSLNAEKQHELAVQAERLLQFKKKMQDPALTKAQRVALSHEFAFPDKEPEKSQLGTPTERADAADLATQDKANDIARLRALQDTAKFKSDRTIFDAIGDAYNKAGDLAKKVITGIGDVIPDDDVPEPFIDIAPKESPLFGDQAVRHQLPLSTPRDIPDFDTPKNIPDFTEQPNIFPPARIEDTVTPIKTENKTNGIIEYVDGSFGWRNPQTGEVFSGLNRLAVEGFSAYMLANQRGREQWAPIPGSIEEQIYKVKRSFGPPLETIFSAFTGPTTLSEVADGYGVSYEDVQKYQAMQKSTSLSAEQQAFAKTTTYKLLTVADERAKRNQERSNYIREFAETYRKRYPTNDKHIAGATAAFHEVMRAHGGGVKGMFAAAINAFKNDKLTFASQGWDSVGYTIALTMGNIPVQLGIFVAAAMGTAKLAIQDWKKAHNGKEPPPEVIRDIKILSALRIAVEKASAGLLTKYLSELPLVGGPAAWASKVQAEVLKTIDPSVRKLGSFTGRFVTTPITKTLKSGGFEGFQEALDSVLEEWSLIDPATVPEGERWKIDAGKAGVAFVHGSLGIFATGAGVKAVDLTTRTVVKLSDVITSESAAAQYNREYKEKYLDPKIALYEEQLKRAENYKNADPKVIKELETVNEELKELLSIDREGAEIGPNGEVITDSTYIKENFLALSLQIERGELTPEEALEQVISQLETELSSKTDTRDNLASQVPKALTFGEIDAGKTDVAAYEVILTRIKELELETELTEEQTDQLSRARREAERLRNKLEQPALPELIKIHEDTYKPKLEGWIKERDTKSYQITWGIGPWGHKPKYPQKPEEVKPEESEDNSITDDEFDEILEEIDKLTIIPDKEERKEPAPEEPAPQTVPETVIDDVVVGKTSTFYLPDGSPIELEVIGVSEAGTVKVRNEKGEEELVDGGRLFTKSAASPDYKLETITGSPEVGSLSNEDLDAITKRTEEKVKIHLEARKAGKANAYFNMLRELNALKLERKQREKNKVTIEIEKKIPPPDGSIELEMVAPVGEGVTPEADLNFANFDPSGEWRVGDIVTVKDSPNPEIQNAQGFAIEYILAEQVRDGKIHVKLKGLSETIPIDQLEEVVARTDRSPQTAAERLEVLSRKDLTDEQRTKLRAAYGKEIDALKKKLNIKIQKLGSIESFENIDKESDDSVNKKANDSTLPATKQQFYKDVLALRKAKAIRAKQESLNPNLKTMGGVHRDILHGESKQWKGLYSYYTDLVNAYTEFKNDKVLRDQRVDALLSQMGTHSDNLNKKLDKFKEARSIMGTVPPGNVAAVVGTSTRTDDGMRTMRYDIVTNMTEAEVKAEQDKGNFITQIDQNSDSLIRTLEQEATYGNYIMEVVRGYEKSPMKGQVSDQELSIEKHEEVLRKLTQARDGIERVIKPISKETIKGIGVPKGEKAPPTGKAAPSILDKQLEDTVKRANELADKKGKTKEEWNELNKLSTKMRSLNEQIEKRDAEDRKPEGEDILPEGPPPVSDEAPPVVRTPSEQAKQEARKQEEADTFVGPKPLQTFIEGATQIYRNVVGRALDIVLGLAGATFTDLIQIGPLKKVKGINTLQDIDFNNDKTLTAALINLGVKPETASVLVGAFNSFKARYDNIIHDEIRFDDEVFWIGKDVEGASIEDVLHSEQESVLRTFQDFNLEGLKDKQAFIEKTLANPEGNKALKDHPRRGTVEEQLARMRLNLVAVKLQIKFLERMDTGEGTGISPEMVRYMTVLLDKAKKKLSETQEGSKEHSKLTAEISEIEGKIQKLLKEDPELAADLKEVPAPPAAPTEVSGTIYTIVDGGLHVEKGGAYNVKGDYTKIIDADKNEKIVLTSELVNARVDALNKPLSLLLRTDPENPKNTQGRLPDQIVFTMMLSNLIFRQQTPNNNRWGDRDFAKQSFLFGGDNKTLNDTEEGEVSELGYGYHDTGADQGANIIALMDFSSKKIAKDHPHITQAGADAYFDSLGPGLGMMAMEIANGADMLFTIETHIWNFGNYDPERTYNDTKDITEEDIRDPETYGYKHLKVNPGVYKQFADKFKKPLKDIIEVVGTNIDPSAGPLQKPPAVTTFIKGTFSSIFEEGEVFSALRKLQNAKWKKNAAMDTVSDLEDYKTVLWELMDIESEHETEMKDGKLQWKLDSENKKIPLHHDKKMKSIKSSNKDKTDVLDELLAANTREELNEFYFKYELQNHHRIMMTGRVNPQQSKIARFLLKSWKAQKYNEESLWQFKLAVAQNFGEKVDKKEFRETEADFETITNNENVLKAIDALTRLNSAKERNSAKDKKQAAGDLAKAMSAVKKDFPKGNMSLLNAVTALSQYMSVKPDNRYKSNFRIEKNTSFESDLVFQIDGIANGWAMNVLQFPMWKDQELARKLAQVGNYFGKNNQHDLSQTGAYEELVELVREAEELGNGYSVAWEYYKKNYRNRKYPKLADSYLNDQGEPDFKKFANQYKLLDSSLTALYPALKDDETMRDVLKYPFMMKMYGGGMKRISGDVSTDIIKDIYSQIGVMQVVYNELQKSKPDPKIVKQLKAEYDITVENIDREVKSFGNSLKHLGGVAKAEEFISAIKSNTARNLKINDQTLHAKISTTIAPRIDYGLEQLLGSSVIAPRTSVIQMGEMLHGVFITHYERAYKDKLAEVNAEYEKLAAEEDKYKRLADLIAGQGDIEVKYSETITYIVTSGNKIFNIKDKNRKRELKLPKAREKILDKALENIKSERANRTELTSREIRDLIQDASGDLIKVYPQFAGPLSRLAKNGSFHEGFVDLAKTKRVRKEKDFTDTGIQESKVSVYLKDKDGKRTERLTTTAQLQFIEPGVSALIRQIINMDAAILTQTVNGDPNLKLDKKFRLKDKGQLWQGDANLLLLHDAAMGTPGQLIPFGKNYNKNYMQFNKDNSIIEKTFDQLKKVLDITEAMDNADRTALEETAYYNKKDAKILKEIIEGEARTKEGLVVIREIKKLHKKAIGLYRDEDRSERKDIEEQISQYGEQLTHFAKKHGLDYDKLKMEYNNARTTATPTRMDDIKKFIFNESRNNKFKENWRERKTLDDLVAQNKAVKNNVLKFRRQLNETISKEGGMESFQMYMPPGSLNDNGTLYKAEKAKVNESVRKARKKKEKKPKAKKTRFKSVKRFVKKIWTLADVSNDPDTIFIFGDNLQRIGKAGQAGIRDLANAFGIPTKKKPSMTKDSFFTDNELEKNKRAINNAFLAIPEGSNIMLSQDGLGTGRAQLKTKAPKTWAYLQDIITYLEKNSELPSYVVGKTKPATTTNTTKPLNIWAGAGQGAILSNLANRPFTYEGKKYKSVEHAYQTLKSGEFDADIYNKRWGFNNKIRNPKPAKTDNRYNIKLMEKLIEASLSAQSKESIAARDALRESIGRTITHTGGRQDIWTAEFPRILTKLRDKLFKEEKKPEAPPIDDFFEKERKRERKENIAKFTQQLIELNKSLSESTFKQQKTYFTREIKKVTAKLEKLRQEDAIAKEIDRIQTAEEFREEPSTIPKNKLAEDFKEEKQKNKTTAPSFKEGDIVNVWNGDPENIKSNMQGSQLKITKIFDEGEAGIYVQVEGENTLHSTNNIELAIPREDIDEFLTSLKDADKGKILLTEQHDDITSENVNELFDQMESLSHNHYDSKEEMDEHTSALGVVMSIVSEGFDTTRAIELVEEQIEGISQGEYLPESESMTLSINQGTPTTRNGQSPQEIYVHEMVHAMSVVAINEKPLVASRIEKLYAHIHKSLEKEYGKGNEWKVFRPAGTGPTSLASEAEMDMAKLQYKTAFLAEEENRLHEFLAYSSTNRHLMNFMSKTPVGKREGLMGKLMDAIRLVVDTVKELLGYKVYKAQNSSSLAEALAITEQLVAAQNKHKSKHTQRQSKLYKALDKSDQIVRDFADRVGLNIRKKSLQVISETKDGKRRMKSGMTNVLTTYATGIVNVPHITLSNHASVQIHRMGLMSTLNHTLRGIANEVGGGALSNELKEQLLHAKITISKLRQETERFYIDWFNNAWKSMSPDELENGAMSFETREALTDVILRTDLASLRLTSGLGLDGPGSTQKIMNLIGKDNSAVAQRGTLKKIIKQKLNLTANDPAIAYADELGHWIATGHTERISGAYNSAASIAFDHLEDPTEEQVGWLDAFATLVALDDIDERKIALVQGLSKNEFNANATDNGIIDLLDTHIHYKTESREGLFDGDAVPMMKGYIVERMDNLTDIKIKPAADKERMADSGYTHSYPVSTTDKDQTHDTMYINRNMPEVSDISGIMSTTNQRNMGTTLTEILMKNPKYIDSVTNKPNFGQIKNTIDRFKKDQAALAKQLKIDPRFKFRPVRHPETNVITDFRIMMDHKSTKELLRPDLEFQNVFAHMQSRLIDRKNTIKNDIETVNLLIHEQADLLKVHPDQFIDLLDPDGPYIDRYRKLPKAVREYIQEFAVNNTFMVRHDIVEKVFGFKQLDITQLKVFQGDHPLQLRAKQIAGLTHYAVRQTVGYGKNRIVLAMPEVVFGNMFSNVAQLSMRKISLPYIINKIIEGIHEYRKYSRDSKEIAKLEHLINTKKLDKKKSPEALKVERLKVRLKRNKLDKMVKAGLDSLIVEDLNEAQIDGYFNRMKRVLFKGALKDVGTKIPKSLQTIASTLFWAKGSIGYNFSRQIVQMTDFLGRYVMIEHAMAIQGHTFKRAMHDALDAFVLFDESLIAALEALEMTGATAFLSYWLRNQRASRQLLQASPTAVGISAALQYSTGVATLGNVNSSWLGGDFSPNLMQFPNLFDEANNASAYEITKDILGGGLYQGLLD